MVNFVTIIEKLLFHGMMKLAGLKPKTVKLEEETTMSFWVPSSKTSKKPAVVLIQGFIADGVVTWQLQVGALTSKYKVYVPDLLFFGDSITSSTDRSPTFQAKCLAKALTHLGVDRCTVVGFSYGGMVAFKMAELYPQLVSSLVISGSMVAMTNSFTNTTLQRLNYSSWSEMLLPNTVKDLKALFSVGTHKKLWYPDRLLRDCLKVMFNNRKERGELLESLVISDKDATIPKFSQAILLLWGENDKIFNLEFAKNMKDQLGDKATLQGIKNAGHLVHIERPCVYNRCLKEFLHHSQQADGAN